MYEKFTWTFFVVQLGVAGWFIYAVFVDQKGLLWKCKNVVRAMTKQIRPALTLCAPRQFGSAVASTSGADDSMNPKYESLDPAKACKLLEKRGPMVATLGCLIILAKELGTFFGDLRHDHDTEIFM